MSRTQSNSPNIHTRYTARLSTVSRVFGFPVSPECPVVVERGAFLRDNTFGKFYLQLRLRNCGRGIIRSVHLQGVLVNAAGQPMGDSRFAASYDEVLCEENASFGTKTLIPVNAPQKYVRLESVSVVMGDGTTAEFAGTDFPKVLQVRPFTVPGPYYDLVDNAEEVMVETYRYAPDVYLCNCGTLVVRSDICPHCRKTWQTVSEESSPEGLAARRNRAQQTVGNDSFSFSEASAAAGAAAGAAARASRETARNIQRASRETAAQASSLFTRLRPYLGTVLFGSIVLVLLLLIYTQPEGSELWYGSTYDFYKIAGEDGVTHFVIHGMAVFLVVVVAVLFGPRVGAAYGLVSSLFALLNPAFFYAYRFLPNLLFNVAYGLLIGLVAEKLHLSIRDSAANKKVRTWGLSAVVTALSCLAVGVLDFLLYNNIGALLGGIFNLLIYGTHSMFAWTTGYITEYRITGFLNFRLMVLAAALILLVVSRALFLAFPAEPGLTQLLRRLPGRHASAGSRRPKPTPETTSKEVANYDQLDDVIE